MAKHANTRYIIFVAALTVTILSSGATNTARAQAQNIAAASNMTPDSNVNFNLQLNVIVAN